MNIGLIGDFQEDVTAHQAIPRALAIAATTQEKTVEYKWLHSDTLSETSLDDFDGLWCVPASPYRNSENVLQAICYARSENVPFLGTCGGYQYAALEYVRNRLNMAEAGNTEVNPTTPIPLISSLVCKLYDEEARIDLKKNSQIAKIYGATSISEEYFCGYGVNREYLNIFEGSGMYFSGFDEDGDPRSLEISSNKFFIGTAFQPERSALKGTSHPLISAFLHAVTDT